MWYHRVAVLCMPAFAGRESYLLPDLGCRGTEVVEATVRHHIGACFGALERRILDAVAAATQRLRDGGRGGAASPASEHSLLQVGRQRSCQDVAERNLAGLHSDCFMCRRVIV